MALVRPEELIHSLHLSISWGLMTSGELMAWGKAESHYPQLSINSIIIRPDTSPQVVFCFLWNGGTGERQVFPLQIIILLQQSSTAEGEGQMAKAVRPLVNNDFSWTKVSLRCSWYAGEGSSFSLAHLVSLWVLSSFFFSSSYISLLAWPRARHCATYLFFCYLDLHCFQKLCEDFPLHLQIPALSPDDLKTPPGK